MSKELARPWKANGKLIHRSLRTLRGHKCAAVAKQPVNLMQSIDFIELMVSAMGFEPMTY